MINNNDDFMLFTNNDYLSTTYEYDSSVDSNNNVSFVFEALLISNKFTM